MQPKLMLEKFRKGDRDAGNSFSRWAYQLLIGMACSLLHQKADAENAIQDTILQLLRKDMSFNNDEHVERWLKRVCFNECMNIRRGERPTEDRPIELPGREPDPLNLIEQEELEQQHALQRQLLIECLKKLSHKNQELIRLKYYAKMTSQAVADELGLRDKDGKSTPNIANSRIKSAVSQLLTCMGLVSPRGQKSP